MLREEVIPAAVKEVQLRHAGRGGRMDTPQDDAAAFPGNRAEEGLASVRACAASSAHERFTTPAAAGLSF